MTRWASTFCAAGAIAAAAMTPISAGQAAPAVCVGAADCRAQTEAAIALGDHERAHDLAWRAVQQGTRNDPALMYLLARTQALSGRPDDAMVMLRRLAEQGVAADASSDEFRRTRDLPGWPVVEALIAHVGDGGPSAGTEVPPLLLPLPAESASAREMPRELRRDLAVAAAGREGRPVEPVEPVATNSAGSFSSVEFAPGGLACDAVSGRYVLGDQPGRKLQILAEGADHSIDLTRAVSAGFLDVMALDIDTANGTLWVASAEADGRAATLHRLQLVSGRALDSVGVPEGLAPVRPVDMSVTASGLVLLLDAVKSRMLAFRPGAPAIELLALLPVVAPTSLTVGSRDGVAYVSHRDGIARLDVRTRVVSPLPAPNGTGLGGIERLRRYATGLVGVQAMSDGSRRLVRLSLDAAGGMVTGLAVIDVPLPPGPAPVLTAVCGDTLAFLVGETVATADRATAWTIRRIRLVP